MPQASAFHHLPAQSEVRVGLRTTLFGNVEVHAVVRESQVGLTIGSEHGELPHLLANEVPVLVGRLQQHDLQLGAVRFVDSALGASTGFSSGADPRGRPAWHAPSPSAHDSFSEDDRVPLTHDPVMWANAHPGLNVRA